MSRTLYEPRLILLSIQLNSLEPLHSCVTFRPKFCMSPVQYVKLCNSKNLLPEKVIPNILVVYCIFHNEKKKKCFLLNLFIVSLFRHFGSHYCISLVTLLSKAQTIWLFTEFKKVPNNLTRECIPYVAVNTLLLFHV